MGNWNMAGFLHEGREIRTLREVLKRLKEAYCGTIGYEYMHIPDRERCNWLRERIETPEKVRGLQRHAQSRCLLRAAYSEMRLQGSWGAGPCRSAEQYISAMAAESERSLAAPAVQCVHHNVHALEPKQIQVQVQRS